MDKVEILSKINWIYVCGAIIAAIVAAKYISDALEWLLVDKLGIETKAQRKRREEHELLIVTNKELAELKKKHKNDFSTFENNQLNYREQSIGIQKEWEKSQIKIFNSLSLLADKLDEMQKNTDERFKASEEKQNERVQAELKDKIGDSYRHYHEIGKINDMELEALEGLIKSYENHGGENSFVHSIVQKEMYTWEQI